MLQTTTLTNNSHVSPHSPHPPQIPPTQTEHENTQKSRNKNQNRKKIQQWEINKIFKIMSVGMNWLNTV